LKEYGVHALAFSRKPLWDLIEQNSQQRIRLEVIIFYPIYVT